MNRRLLAAVMAASVFTGLGAAAEAGDHHGGGGGLGGGSGGGFHGGGMMAGPAGGFRGGGPGGFRGPAMTARSSFSTGRGVSGARSFSRAASVSGRLAGPRGQRFARLSGASSGRLGGRVVAGGPRGAAAAVAGRFGRPAFAQTARAGFGAQTFGAQRVQARFDPRAFPRTVIAPRQVHWVGSWSPQPGFFVRDWEFGDILPFGWFAPPFWIVDYWYYGLPLAPPGFVWVRVGPDGLLVDLATGEVVEVVHSLFW